MKICVKCQKKWDDTYAFCPKDGTALEKEKEEVVDAPADPLVGKLVHAEYRIIEKMADGGMGSIYKAEHVTLGIVALKVLHSERMEDLDFAQRFKREEKYTGVLKHPNIVKIYELNELEDGRLFIAMEYLKGEDLEKVIEREGALAAARAIAITKQVAGALAEAHRRNIIHRDIKPSNIMIDQEDNGRDKATLLDFGIAKRVGTLTISQPLTKVGMILGTFEYSSPEQLGALKRDEKIDGRSDIYSLGIVMYEMLTGQTPFEDSKDIFEAHKSEKPKRLSLVRPDLPIPSQLENIVLKALEKDRRKRHQSMEELIADLSEAQIELPAGAYSNPNTPNSKPVGTSATPSQADPLAPPGAKEFKPEIPEGMATASPSNGPPHSDPPHKLTDNPRPITPPERPKEPLEKPAESDLDATVIIDRSQRPERGHPRPERQTAEDTSEETIILSPRAPSRRPRRPPPPNRRERVPVPVEPAAHEKGPGRKLSPVVLAVSGIILALGILVLYLIFRPKLVKLTVTSIPSGASVTIDGDRKAVTNFFINDLPAGTHTIKISLEGYEEQEKIIEGKRGDDLVLSFNLKKKERLIETRSDPRAEIAPLLEKARLAYRARQYVSPAEDCALKYIQDVLARDPGNQEALRIRDDTAQALYSEALRRAKRDRSDAKRLAQDALKVNPNHVGAERLLRTLSRESQTASTGSKDDMGELTGRLNTAIGQRNFFTGRDSAWDILKQMERKNAAIDLSKERERIRRGAFEQANAAYQAGKPDTAWDQINELLVHFPSDKEASDLKAKIEADRSRAAQAAKDKDERARKSAYSNQWTRAKQQGDNRQYAEACRTLEAMNQSYPDLFAQDATAKSFLKEMTAKRDEQARLNQPVSCQVTHSHKLGKCEGILTVSSQGVKYESESNSEDNFNKSLAEIQNPRASGRKLHLEIGGRNYNFESKEGEQKIQAIADKINQLKK